MNTLKALYLKTRPQPMKPWQYYTCCSKMPQIMDDIKSIRKIKVCPYLYKKFQIMKAMENKKTLSI
ncbi:MAG: hypothetical protein ACTSQO_14585 [Candidatus Helarchaeota archaeon]